MPRTFPWPAPRSAYIHVPFCRHRCGYCNFSVVTNRDHLIQRYLSAVDQELALLESPEIDTLFIGGGTPTHLDCESLQRLLNMVSQRLHFADDFEWTIEANPEDIDEATLELLCQYGVNRISLGVQSFNDTKLKTLERGHRRDETARIVQQVADVIANVSIDLIFAAPGESVAQWREDLLTAISLPIQHLSTYALTFEKGTQFWNRRLHGQIHPVAEATEVAMYELTREVTATSGFGHYEISSFAKPGKHCRHNTAYWEGRGWFAAGPGAARFVDGQRDVNHRSTTNYLKRMEAGEDPVAESESISPEGYARERAAFGVRMLAGIDIDSISAETGVELRELCAAAIQQCESEGLIEFSDDRLRLTHQGVMFADRVAREFLG